MENIGRKSHEKAASARAVLSNMTEEHRGLLKDMIIAIGELQNEINDAENTSETNMSCKDCKESCCNDIVENGIEEIDYLIALFLATKEERDNIFQALEDVSENGKCSLLGNNGCLLPKTYRPAICKTYYCELISDQPANSLGHMYYMPMIANTRGLESEIEKLGYNLTERT